MTKGEIDKVLDRNLRVTGVISAGGKITFVAYDVVGIGHFYSVPHNNELMKKLEGMDEQGKISNVRAR